MLEMLTNSPSLTLEDYQRTFTELLAYEKNTYTSTHPTYKKLIQSFSPLTLSLIQKWKTAKPFSKFLPDTLPQAHLPQTAHLNRTLMQWQVTHTPTPQQPSIVTVNSTHTYPIAFYDLHKVKLSHNLPNLYDDANTTFPQSKTLYKLFYLNTYLPFIAKQSLLTSQQTNTNQTNTNQTNTTQTISLQNATPYYNFLTINYHTIQEALITLRERGIPEKHYLWYITYDNTTHKLTLLESPSSSHTIRLITKKHHAD